MGEDVNKKRIKIGWINSSKTKSRLSKEEFSSKLKKEKTRRKDEQASHENQANLVFEWIKCTMLANGV